MNNNFKIEYTLKANVNGVVPALTLKSCDISASAFDSMLRISCKLKYGRMASWLMFLPTVFWFRKITKTKIIYTFPFLFGKKHLECFKIVREAMKMKKFFN